MKKALTLLLALCMALTLCACADSSEKEFEAAKALYDAGSYEEAIEALQNVGHYTEITAMIEDAQKQLTAQDYGFLFTTWVNVLWPDDTFELREDGTYATEGLSAPYTVENDCLTVADIVRMNILQEDGIYRIAAEGADYVREEDFDRFVEEHTVELTLDNYLDYYEWVETRREEKDAYGNVDYVSIYYELKLKEAYEGRVSTYLSEAEIGYTYERTYFSGENLVIDFDTLEYSGVSYSDTETESETARLYQDGGWPSVGYEEQYVAESGYVVIEAQPEIVRVEGRLVIR